MLPAKLIVNILASAFICVIGTVGNFLVIYAFIRTKSLQTIANMFIFQLALGDFAKASVIMTAKVINQSQLKTTTIDLILCGVSGCVSYIAFVQAALVLAIIAVARYLKVVRPNLHDKVFTTRKAFLYGLGIFVITFAFSLLPFVRIGKYDYSIFHGVCFADWSEDNKIFRSLFYVLTVGIPYPILIYCYGKIFVTLRNHSRNIMPKIRFHPSTEFGERKLLRNQQQTKLTKTINKGCTGNDEKLNYEQNSVIDKVFLGNIMQQLEATSNKDNAECAEGKHNSEHLDSSADDESQDNSRGKRNILNDLSIYAPTNVIPPAPLTNEIMLSRLSLNHATEVSEHLHFTTRNDLQTNLLSCPITSSSIKSSTYTTHEDVETARSCDLRDDSCKGSKEVSHTPSGSSGGKLLHLLIYPRSESPQTKSTACKLSTNSNMRESSPTSSEASADSFPRASTNEGAERLQTSLESTQGSLSHTYAETENLPDLDGQLSSTAKQDAHVPSESPERILQQNSTDADHVVSQTFKSCPQKQSNSSTEKVTNTLQGSAEYSPQKAPLQLTRKIPQEVKSDVQKQSSLKASPNLQLLPESIKSSLLYTSTNVDNTIHVSNLLKDDSARQIKTNIAEQVSLNIRKHSHPYTTENTHSPSRGAKNGASQTTAYIGDQLYRRGPVSNGHTKPTHIASKDTQASENAENNFPQATVYLAKETWKLRMTQMEIQVTKLMFAIVLLFSFCWLPAFFVNVLKLSNISLHDDITFAAITIVDLKVCLNPLIYGIGNKQFRKRWKQIFNDLLVERTDSLLR